MHESVIGNHIDTVTLQLADPAAPRDGELDFQDRTAPSHGDY